MRTNSLRPLILLTILVFTGVISAISYFGTEQLSAYGSIVSAAGSLLAVIWFSASLFYQARQLEEQRLQFAAQFNQSREAHRRESLLTAKTIIEEAKAKAMACCPGITVIEQLPSKYLDFHELKPLSLSTDRVEVMLAYKSWMEKEGAAVTFINGVKSAAEIYLRSIDTPNIDYKKSAEEFVYIYSSYFDTQPFFSSVCGTANILSNFLFMLKPGREAAKIAFWVACAKDPDNNFIKIDKIRADIEAHLKHNYPLPKIAEGF